MPHKTLEPWLRDREPEIPALLLPRLVAMGGEASGPSALVEGGLKALSRALDRPGRDREAAFLLLAADALFTYACETLARVEDPGEELLRGLERMGSRFEP